MARMIGRTKVCLWWLIGAVCAFLFSGPVAWAAEFVAKYGPPWGETPTPPPATQPAVSPAERAEIQGVVEQYLAPVTAVEPTAEQAADILKLLGLLGGDDRRARLQARQALVAFGPAALGKLRETVAAGGSAAVMARDAVAALEAAARETFVNQLAPRGEAARLVVGEAQRAAAADAQTQAVEAVVAELAAKNLAAQNDPGAAKAAAAAAELRAKADATQARADALSTLQTRLTPAGQPMATFRPPTEMPVAKYGPPAWLDQPVQALYGVRAPQENQ